MEENSRGSGSPRVICICLIADRYTFIVWVIAFHMLNKWSSNTTKIHIQEMVLKHCTMNKS